MVNWYDAALFDAAAQLRQGRDVRLDIAVFEIGETAWFVENLFRFVNEGFAGGRPEDRTSADRLGTTHPGNLTVRFLWQFQSGDGKAETSTAALLRGPAVIRRTDPATGNAYTIEMARVWPKLDPTGIAVNPGTPHDMHNKFMTGVEKRGGVARSASKGTRSPSRSKRTLSKASCPNAAFTSNKISGAAKSISCITTGSSAPRNKSRRRCPSGRTNSAVSGPTISDQRRQTSTKLCRTDASFSVINRVRLSERGRSTV